MNSTSMTATLTATILALSAAANAQAPAASTASSVPALPSVHAAKTAPFPSVSGSASARPVASAPIIDAGLADASSSLDASTDVADAGTPADASTDAADAHERVWASCTESIPDGVTRPDISVTFPARGTTGHAAILQVTLKHGLGETVFPAGFRIHAQSDAARALSTAHFLFPDPKGPARPNVKTSKKGSVATTVARLPFVPLPPDPGRHKLTLPPIPIAIARANGQVMTVCTTPKTMTVDDPTANEPNAKPKPNPKPRQQRETWTLMRDITYGVAIGLLIALVLGWLLLKWLRRPRPEPPPPPPRPPWEVALEELEQIRASSLLHEGKLTEHVDRVSDALRRYLGGRYGFDGIESTTDEVLDEIRRRHEAGQIFDSVRRLLQEGDLVKFARMTPRVEDCVRMLNRVEDIVRSTTPRVKPKLEDPSGTGEATVAATSDNATSTESEPVETLDPSNGAPRPETDETHQEAAGEAQEQSEIEESNNDESTISDERASDDAQGARSSEPQDDVSKEDA